MRVPADRGVCMSYRLTAISKAEPSGCFSHQEKRPEGSSSFELIAVS
jgi:hypothetical protein